MREHASVDRGPLVRVGVIGVGNRSNLLIDQLPEGAEVVAVAGGTAAGT